jgi:hypothetical protein
MAISRGASRARMVGGQETPPASGLLSRLSLEKKTEHSRQHGSQMITGEPCSEAAVLIV